MANKMERPSWDQYFMDIAHYTTFSPCLLCAKMIINAGIVEVVYHQHYSIDETSLGLLHEGGVVVRPLEDESGEKQS